MKELRIWIKLRILFYSVIGRQHYVYNESGRMSSYCQKFVGKSLVIWCRNKIFVDFYKALGSVRRDKLYEVMKLHLFVIPSRFIWLKKVAMEVSTYHVKIWPRMADGFKVGNCLSQGHGLAPTLFNIALEHVRRQLSVRVESTIFYKSVQLTEYADDTHVEQENNRSYFWGVRKTERENKRSRALLHC